MNFALSVIAKTTILLACASLLTLGLRRASASARHAVWALALLSALILPFASLVGPEVAVPVLPEEASLMVVREAIPVSPPSRASAFSSEEVYVSSSGTVSDVSPARTEDASFSFTRQQTLLFLWAIGAGVVLIRLAVGSLTIRRLARQSIRVEDKEWKDLLEDVKSLVSLRKPIVLRVARQTIPPMTWGVFRHVVLLPASAQDWSEDRRRLVLAHELAHVKRNDGVLQILLQAVCSLHWFNPLVWYAARRLRIERECACDDQVLKLGANPDDYADHLLQVARTLNPGGGLTLATVAMAHRSQLETRLLSILDNRTHRRALSRVVSIGLLGFITTITLIVASVHLTARPGALVLDMNPAVPGIPADFDDPPTEAVSSPVDVHGSVEEFGSRLAVQGALVTLTADSERFDAETLSDGTFRIRDVPPGQYRLGVSGEGFVGVHSASEPALLTVFNGHPPEPLHLHLMRGPAVSGRIFDEAGNPKTGARVELLRMEFRDGNRALLASDISMVTDDAGEYRLPALPPGEYYLRVRPRAGGADFLPVYFPGVTDSQFATPINVVAGADISGIDLSLTRGNQHSVRLKVEIAEPTPANPELSFYINPRQNAGTAGSGAVQFHSAGVNTYVSPLLSPGSYEIEVYLRDPDPIRWAHTMVDIGDRDVDAGTLTIGPGVWIKGHVTPAEALPVSVRRGQLLVLLRPLDGSIFLLPSAQVADDGSFVIPRVPERRFRVEVTGLPPEVYFASARYGGKEVVESGFTASSQANSVLDLSIASSGGVVAGVVRNNKDQPIANGAVVLIPADRENLNSYRTASTDQFGVFSIAGVPPGEYGVLAWTESRGKSYLDPVFLKAVENQATKVVVQRGFTNTINVRAIAP